MSPEDHFLTPSSARLAPEIEGANRPAEGGPLGSAGSLNGLGRSRCRRASADVVSATQGGGAELGIWAWVILYPGYGPVVNGLNILAAVAGGVVVGAVVEVFYRLYIRPRQAAKA